jgi:repressor LexA
MKLTRRQKEVLDFVKEFKDREGYSPSMEEIAANFRIASLNAVYKHLEALQERGFLHRDPNRARSIELTDERLDAQSLPLLGMIAAGKPIEAVEDREALTVPAELASGRGNHYVLRVRGDSMIEEHIADGDFVIVESVEHATDGDTVVALVDGESVTLKKLYREGGNVRLQPANAAIDPLILASERVRVQGRVTGVMRKYR